jgi:hypothetical protein
MAFEHVHVYADSVRREAKLTKPRTVVGMFHMQIIRSLLRQVEESRTCIHPLYLSLPLVYFFFLYGSTAVYENTLKLIRLSCIEGYVSK